MYQLGKRKRRSKAPYIIGGILLMLFMVGIGSYGFIKYANRNSTTIKNGSPTVRYVGVGSTQKSHFDEGVFGFDLPPAWKLVNHQTSLYNLYTFQGTTSVESSRIVSVYQDSLPVTMAVNRVVSVQSQGAGLSHGTVSDNCVNFATEASRATPEATQNLITPLRWDGVDFICDLGNYNRNITGTSAQGSINKVTLTGPSSGAHSFFILYTDNNINPDYTVLYNLLDSFRVK